MAEKNHTYQIISVILLLAVIVFAGLYFTKSIPNCPEVEEKECPQPEQKAIVKMLDILANETNKLDILYNKELSNLSELKKSVMKKIFT